MSGIITEVQELQREAASEEKEALPPIYIGNEGLPESWDELKQQQPPALIPGMLHERSKAILGAPAKVGKTFYSLGLAHALAKGGQWLGTDLEPRRVLVADLELHEHELNSRLWHISAQGGKPDLPENLARLPLRRFPEHRGRAKLLSTLRTVSEQQGGFDLIILDCLYRFLDGLDENATADMSELGKWLDTLVEATQSAVLVVHHFGKGSPGQREQIDRFRGSSTLAGEFDALMTLIPHETEDHYILETTLRSFAKPPPKVLHFDFPTFKLTDEEPTPKKPGAPAKVSDDRILQAVPIGRANAITAKDLAANLGVSKRRVQERLVVMNGIETEKIGQTCHYFR